jgi:hypothetical protein
MAPRARARPFTCEIRKATASSSRDRQLTGSEPPSPAGFGQGAVARSVVRCCKAEGQPCQSPIWLPPAFQCSSSWGRFSGLARRPAGVNSRAGLAFAYATPVFVYTALWVEGGSPRTLYHLAVFGAFLFHFLRRLFEVSLVNSYSRPTPLCALVIIASLYGVCQRRSKNTSVCRSKNTSAMLARRPPNWGPFVQASGLDRIIRRGVRAGTA